jgi:hypothetical protein
VSEGGAEQQLKVQSISLNKQHQVLAFVHPMLNVDVDNNAWRCGRKTRQVMFHDRIKLLQDKFEDAPRDLWEGASKDAVHTAEFAHDIGNWPCVVLSRAGTRRELFLREPLDPSEHFGSDPKLDPVTS